jgi:hypothetical protein
MHLVLAVVGCWLAVGCSSVGEAPLHGETAVLREEEGRAIAGAERERALIRRASITITVLNLGDGAREIREIAATAGGIVFKASISKETSATFTLRVPVETLDATLDALAELGEEQEREISASDVSDRLVDLEAQLGNKKASRERLHHLLQRTAKVEEVLSIERELSRLQGEIDTLAGQLNRMRSAAAMSSIQVRLN